MAATTASRRRDETAVADMLAGARAVVVKIGSSLLVDPETGLRAPWLAGLAKDLAELRADGARVLVVSSGAIALGRRILELPATALSLEQAQAAASVGQIALARAYVEALAAEGMPAGQVLLTLGDTQDRRRYLNGCATLKTLLDLGVVPVVNENDTVATDEIRYGDNDRLAARVALMAAADRLVLLSDVDGLYTADPRKNPDARRLEVVPELTAEIEAMATGAGTAVGSGGMVTKLLAAKTATAGGCAMAVAQGAAERPLSRLRAGEGATWFLASATPRQARKQWIAGMKPMGALIVDDGAAVALRRGGSLLPAGVRAVEGVFERGDPVAIRDLNGHDLGAALAGYPSDEAHRILGRRSGELAAVLGHPARAEMAHRDDMALWDGAGGPARDAAPVGGDGDAR